MARQPGQGIIGSDARRRRIMMNHVGQLPVTQGHFGQAHLGAKSLRVKLQRTTKSARRIIHFRILDEALSDTREKLWVASPTLSRKTQARARTRQQPRIAADDALARLARHEADYFSRLNDDDEYLAAELRRINWLQSIYRARRIAARVTFASILLALFGGSITEAASDIGWSLATSSLICWIGVGITARLLTPRRKFRTAE